ncbi:uncharacterized protein LOC142614853 isoform X1 [Castanea sativa]|uniref:uncharacterized protein LOC142614853 isoform X1 n=1 Tax=Castanea sativa TaxID=21020 RepID=UPI003F64F104
MASKASTPPYPSASKLSDSLCYSQYSASLKCLEEYGSDKSKCQEHFDIYKECKKKEIKHVASCIVTLKLFCSYRCHFSDGASLNRCLDGREWKKYVPLFLK